MPTPTWYADDRLATMRRDDAHLQRVYRAVRRRVLHHNQCHPAWQQRLQGVHAYPSRACTYTIGKRRLFVRVRDAEGAPFRDCVLQYVLLHELAHVLNEGRGHDAGFHALLSELVRCAGAAPPADPGWTCSEGVLSEFNRCHGRHP